MDDLDRIGVANPCTESWEGMVGDDRVRFCGKCEQNVYRLTDLPRAEANELLARSQAGEEICVRFARRADGTVVTNDCPSQLERGRASLPLLNAAKTIAAGLVATLGAGLSTGCFEDDTSMTTGRLAPAQPAQGQRGPQGQQQPEALPGQEPAPRLAEEFMGNMICPSEPASEAPAKAPRYEDPEFCGEAVQPPQQPKRLPITQEETR